MRRHPSQTFALVVAGLCYLASIACAVAAWLHDGGLPADPIRASLMASVVFFIGCGAVLHVIGTAHLKGILSATAQRTDR